MFFLLSKLLLFLINPILWVIVLFALGFRAKTKKRKKQFSFSAIALLLFLSFPLFSNLIVQIWNVPLKTYDEVSHHKYAVVLGGFSNPSHYPSDRVHFNVNANRLTDAVSLYKKDKIDYFLLSGGSGLVGGTPITEADNAKTQLLAWGIPDSVIIIENKSRNTYENLRNTSELYPSVRKDGILLITSAFHMRRSSKIAKKLNIPHETFPCSSSEDYDLWGLHVFLPNGGSIDTWQKITKEIVGLIAYKLKGYI